MTRDPRFDVLFEPIRIGPVTAKNRFYQVPHCCGMGFNWPQSHAKMREMKAEGGWAVVCTEECMIHPSSDYSPEPQARLWDEHDVIGIAIDQPYADVKRVQHHRQQDLNFRRSCGFRADQHNILEATPLSFSEISLDACQNMFIRKRGVFCTCGKVSMVRLPGQRTMTGLCAGLFQVGVKRRASPIITRVRN